MQRSGKKWKVKQKSECVPPTTTSSNRNTLVYEMLYLININTFPPRKKYAATWPLFFSKWFLCTFRPEGGKEFLKSCRIQNIFRLRGPEMLSGDLMIMLSFLQHGDKTPPMTRSLTPLASLLLQIAPSVSYKRQWTLFWKQLCICKEHGGNYSLFFYPCILPPPPPAWMESPEMTSTFPTILHLLYKYPLHPLV